MKKFFLAGAIAISIAALATTQHSQKGSSAMQYNYTLSAYRDTIPQDTSNWPKDTIPRRDSLNLR